MAQAIWRRRLALGLLAVVICCAQTPEAERRLQQLTEHWRWKQYWEGTTELGALYNPGRQFQALFFWRTDGRPPSIGFCSADLGVCHFYADLALIEQNSQMKVPPGDDSQSAFRHFIEDSFRQKNFLARSPPQPRETDFTAELVDITLPALYPPEAIRDRRPRPQAEIDALVASLSCLQEQRGCKVQLLIPFYSPSDVAVPVFRRCSACPNPEPMIIFMKFIEGNWWHGSQDFSVDPEFVRRTRTQIEKALLLEVNR